MFTMYEVKKSDWEKCPQYDSKYIYINICTYIYGYIHINMFYVHIYIYKHMYIHRKFPHTSVGKESVCNTGDPDSIPGWERSPREGNGNPLQYSCLENPMDRGAWWATVHVVARVGHNLVTKPPPCTYIYTHKIRMHAYCFVSGQKTYFSSWYFTVFSKLQNTLCNQEKKCIY